MSDPALAIGREYGIVEGQIFSLMHPAFMFFLLGSSLYAGYLGFQWRRVRELGTEIKGLKAQRDASAPKASAVMKNKRAKRCMPLTIVLVQATI
jgi:hypothetical protein